MKLSDTVNGFVESEFKAGDTVQHKYHGQGARLYLVQSVHSLTFPATQPRADGKSGVYVHFSYECTPIESGDARSFGENDLEFPTH